MFADEDRLQGGVAKDNTGGEETVDYRYDYLNYYGVSRYENNVKRKISPILLDLGTSKAGIGF
jgi:hypothetical protein